MMSSPQRVRDYLEHQVAGAIATWKDVFDRFGYLPGGFDPFEPDGRFILYAGAPYARDWSKVSDTGGYALLIQAIAQWINYLHGTADHELLWEVRVDR